MPNAHRLALVLTLSLPLLGACQIEERPPVSSRGAGGGGGGAAAPLAYTAPHDSLIPDDDLGRSIRRGKAILLATDDSLPNHVGNDLRCTSCHFDAGTRLNSTPWLGVYARFPQYRSRNARINSLEDRVNGCFLRSMNGTALPVGSAEMRDLVAYMAWISKGVPVGAQIQGQGLVRMDPLEGDSGRGRDVFVANCVRCHGANGEGIKAGAVVIGAPLWGDSSYNIGAGMARIRTAAAFIRHNMPFDQPGTLTDQQAFDVAAYMNSHPRPDFAGKENDWPRGDPPPDVAYQTKAGRVNNEQ